MRSFSRRKAGVLRQCVAVMLVGTSLGLCSPAFAGDFISPRFSAPAPAGLGVTLGLASATQPGLPGFGTQASLASAETEFGFQDPSQQQPTQPASHPPERHWTKGGKIMTGIGVGLAVVGIIEFTRTTQPLAQGGVEINWKATGGITMGAAAILAAIGLTRRGD